MVNYTSRNFDRLVKVLLDQVLSSTVERCAEPVLMDQSVSGTYTCTLYTCTV